MRARRRPQAALVVSPLTLALPPLPHGRPKTLQLGLTESPSQHAPAKLGFRYQYLAGGVNTGGGRSTWNLQSKPSPGDEAATDLGHLRDAQLMARYWSHPKTWFTAADYHRHLRYGATFVQNARLRMVAWQIPLGGADGTTSASTDGGYFYARDRAYHAHGPVTLP